MIIRKRFRADLLIDWFREQMYGINDCNPLSSSFCPVADRCKYLETYNDEDILCSFKHADEFTEAVADHFSEVIEIEWDE